MLLRLAALNMERMCVCRALILSLLLQGFSVDASVKYKPNWDSLDSRPLPSWYDEAKIGIFIHWGVFSVPSFGSEWFWQRWQGSHQKDYVNFMKENYSPGFTYQDFASLFKAEFFDPAQWVDIFNISGARYIVPTAKHHEGFTLWPSKYSWNWNAKDVGPNRDLLGDLANALRTRHPHMKFGVYHSMFEWFHPLYLKDKQHYFLTQDFVKTKTMPDLIELVKTYKPELIWSDGSWEAPDWYWQSKPFLAWLFNESPVKDSVVVNDGWGKGISCHHGGYFTCSDNYNPGVLQHHKWEGTINLDSVAWGYRRNAKGSDYRSIEELLGRMAEVISCGGNLLVNVAPTRDGMIPPIMEERLRQMGEWLSVNGEAIYSSKPWQVQNDTLTPGIWYTSKEPSVYALILKWPAKSILTLGSTKATSRTSIKILGDPKGTDLQFKEVSAGLQISLPPQSSVTSQWVWVLKMDGVEPVL